MKKIFFVFAILTVALSSNVLKAEEIEMAETFSITVLDSKTRKIITENFDYTQADQTLPAKTAKHYKNTEEIELRAGNITAIN